MALENFDLIVERAKLSGKKNRVVIAGADAENILLGTFEAQEAGFATPVLVGEADKIVPMLERLGLKDQTYELVETQPEENVVQKAIDLVEQGQGGQHPDPGVPHPPAGQEKRSAHRQVAHPH